jgi:hypothetical protein
MTQLGGLWPKVRDAAGYVDPDAWRQAMQLGEHVGTCTAPDCGQPLKPGRPDTGGRGVTWYPATCISCGHEVLGRSPRPETPTTKRGGV